MSMAHGVRLGATWEIYNPSHGSRFKVRPGVYNVEQDGLVAVEIIDADSAVHDGSLMACKMASRQNELTGFPTCFAACSMRSDSSNVTMTGMRMERLSLDFSFGLPMCVISPRRGPIEIVPRELIVGY